MLLVVLALAPGIFWLWYFRTRDRLRPEPRHLVARTFFLGALASLVAAALEGLAFEVTGWSYRGPFTASTVASAILIGILEETMKFAAVVVGIYRHAQFDEVVDGIIYAVAASLGFATVENLVYVVQGGFSVGVLRAGLSIPAHAFFGALLGFNMGLAKFSGPKERAWLASGLALAAGAHATYDALLFTYDLAASLVIPLLFLLWWLVVRRVRRALALDAQRLGEQPQAADRRRSHRP